MKKNTKHIENVNLKSGNKNYRIKKNSVLGFAYRIYKSDFTLFDIYMMIMFIIAFIIFWVRIPVLIEMYS